MILIQFSAMCMWVLYNRIDVATPKEILLFHLSTLTVKDPCMSCRDSRYRTCNIKSSLTAGSKQFWMVLSKFHLVNVLQQELVQLLQVHIVGHNCK